MKSHKLNRTDDQIEAEVLAKRDDPSAWEKLPFVPPSGSLRPDWMLRNKPSVHDQHVPATAPQSRK